MIRMRRMRRRRRRSTRRSRRREGEEKEEEDKLTVGQVGTSSKALSVCRNLSWIPILTRSFIIIRKLLNFLKYFLKTLKLLQIRTWHNGTDVVV